MMGNDTFSDEEIWRIIQVLSDHQAAGEHQTIAEAIGLTPGACCG